MLKIIPLTDEVEEPQVLRECDFFARSQVWPIHLRIDPREWLLNFEKDELPYAHDLLRAFMYFNDTISAELFRSAVQRLGQFVLDFNRNTHTVQSDWRDFIEGVIVVPVRGEIPRPTDSGYAYVRASRELFGFKETQFLEIDETLRLLRDDNTGSSIQRTILFVDDFVGSGNQFVDTWFRQVELHDGPKVSFDKLHSLTNARFFYCPLICTNEGIEEIKTQCPKVVVSPAHHLSPVYSAFHSESRLWAPERRDSAVDVLKKIAARVQMPDDGADNWRGYCNLGLGIAIRDSMPDACLGVFRFNMNGWRPLLKKPA